MTRKKAGRPSSDQAGIQRQDILNAALAILDSKGPEGLSMRTLAARLKVNPMTLYHHIGNRSELLRALSDMVYSDVIKKCEGETGDIRKKIKTLLTAYQSAVEKHPNLTLSIFATPEAFSIEAQRITQKLIDLLESAKLPRGKAKLWLNILVDYTHGSAIATAMNGANQKKKSTYADEYAQGLNEILSNLFGT